ncbi:uncharacterized protein LOC130449884 isoform X2 [Diorhabda sublineata]|nr:uncharacterized protein LOC130449884 isoform X2 [Diorhabda sublineata]
MPPVPGDREEEETAFQIINQDNFPIAVVGQPILKAFDQDVQKSKPNVIVHPTRRINNNKLEENNDEIKRSITKSHGNLCHNNSADQINLEGLKNELDTDAFTKTLDSKLKRLQKFEAKQQKFSNNTDPPTSKKPFVTTVKKGQFLEPPPEIANLIGMKIDETKIVKKNPKEMKKLYAFSSQPRILSRTPPRTVHQNRCEAAACAAAKLVGTVVGIKKQNENLRETIKPHPPLDKKKLKENDATRTENQPKWNPNFAFAKLLSCDEVDQHRVEQAKRRYIARKKAINQHAKHPKQQVQALYAVPVHLQQKLLELSELQQSLTNKSISDASTQTDTQDYAIDKPKDLKVNDVQVQVRPTDLFDLSSEVKSIVEILVTKTIEEALIEVLEEEEMMTMKEQQRRFLEYMMTKSSEDSLENDHGFSDEKFSTNMFLNSYVPNLITSV